MLGRPQHIYPELLPYRCRERAAMRRFARTFIIGVFIGLARLPIDMLMRQPEGLDIHAVQDLEKAVAFRGNGTAARWFGCRALA